MDSNIDYSISTGISISEFDLDQIPFSIIDIFLTKHDLMYRSELDRRTFILDLYKYLTKNYNFTIQYEYKDDHCKPSVYIDGKYKGGLDWYGPNRKWLAMKDILIVFVCREWHTLQFDLTISVQQSTTITSFEEI